MITYLKMGLESGQECSDSKHQKQVESWDFFEETNFTKLSESEKKYDSVLLFGNKLLKVKSSFVFPSEFK